MLRCVIKFGLSGNIIGCMKDILLPWLLIYIYPPPPPPTRTALVSVSEEVRSRCHLKHRFSCSIPESASSDSISAELASHAVMSSQPPPPLPPHHPPQPMHHPTPPPPPPKPDHHSLAHHCPGFPAPAANAVHPLTQAQQQPQPAPQSTPQNQHFIPQPPSTLNATIPGPPQAPQNLILEPSQLLPQVPQVMTSRYYIWNLMVSISIHKILQLNWYYLNH